MEKKETLTWARRSSGAFAKNIFYWMLQALHGKQLKKRPEEKKLKTVGCITPTMDHDPRNG